MTCAVREIRRGGARFGAAVLGGAALFNGAPNIERTDRLVQMIGAQFGMRHLIVDQTVAEVDARLAINRKAAA